MDLFGSQKLLGVAGHVALISASLLGLMAVVPFLQPYHLLPIPSFYSEWFAFALGVSAGVVLLLPNFWQNLLIPKVTLPFLVLVGIIAVQSVFVKHAYLAQTLLPALYLSWAAVLVIIAGWLRDSLGADKVIAILAWLIFFGGILQSLVGVAQYMNLHIGTTDWISATQAESIIGNIRQRNHFATQITLATIALIYLFAHRRLPLGLMIAPLVLFVLLLTFSGSRAVALYASAVFVLSLLAYRKTRGRVHSRLLLASGSLLLMFLILQYYAPYISEWLKQMLVNRGFDVNQAELLTALERGAKVGLDLRISEWHKAWQMFLQAPILGVGIGNYGWFSFTYQSLPEFSIIPKMQIYTHSHNIFTQILAELGIAGFLTIAFMLFGWLRQFSRNWTTPTSWFIASCLLVLFIHSNLEFPLWYSFFLGPAAVFLGIGDARFFKINFSPRLGQFTAAVSLFFIAVILMGTLYGFRLLTNVNTLVLTTSPEQTAYTLQTISKNPLLTPWAEAAMATHGNPSKDSIQQQLELTTRVMLYRPDPLKVNRQVVYLALAGHTEEATKLLRQSAVVYVEYFPDLVCAMKSMPDPEIRPVLSDAEKLVKTPLNCEAKSAMPRDAS